MRDIKFKAWHTKKKVMFICEEMVADQMALLTDGRFINISGFSTKLSKIDNNVVMIPLQFTGCKDKNGKEIYEGDIVRYSIEGHIQKTPYVIENMIEWFEKMYDTDSYYRWDIDSIEVIGNLYENPELLKAEVV